MKATLQRKSTSTSSSVAGPFFQPKPERTTGDVETSESREPTFFHSSQVEATDGTPPTQPTRAKSAFETRENGHTPFFQQTRGTAIQTETEEHHADTLPVRRKPIFESEADVQFRLLIGQPGDSYEQEADRMADRVAQRLPEHKKAPEPLLSTSRPSLQQTPILESEDALQKLEEPRKEEALQQKPIFESAATPPVDEGEGDEPHNRERGNEDLLQLKCAECAAEEETVQRLESTDTTPVVPDDFSSQLRSNKGSGSTLPDDTRTHMESAFGADFSGVRIHADNTAGRMSESVQAQAFTHGNDIYFGAGQYSPQSTEGQKLLAHELTHTIQQGATVRRKPAETPHETNHANAEPEAGPISQSEHTVQASWWDDLKAGVSAVWDATGGALTNAVLDQLFEAIRPYAPNLVNILQQIRSVGIVGFFKSKLTQAVDSIFGGLQSNIAIIAGIFPQFGALLTRARTIVTALASGDCKPLFAALNELKDLVTQMAGEAWDAIVIFFQPAINFFTDIWQSFGLPAIEWLKQKAAAVWEWVQGIGRSIWNWLLPVREALGSAWDAIKRFLGLNADETGEEGLIQWAQRKAGEIWEGIKEELRPIIEPARALVGKIQALIPLNAILNLRATIQDWLQQAAATATGMGEDASNVGNIAAQTSLRDQILPAIQQSLESFRGSIAAAATWVSGTIGEIYASVTQFFTSVRSISLLNLASGVIGWVETKANELYEWVQSKVAALFDLASQGLHKLGEFLQPVYDTLVKIGQILGNILGYLPDFLLGPLWMVLPQCIKDPIKEFFLTQILGRLPFFQKLQQIEGVWERLQAAAITILKQVFVDGNLRGAIWTFFSTMLDILGLPPQLVTRVIAKGAQALGDILNDPLGFLGNFLQAMKLGLEGFFNNIGTHLLGGLQAWLFSQFEGTGIEMPQDFSFKSMLKLVFQVLGITVDMLLEILEEVTGRKGLKAKVQKVIGAISNAWDWFQKLIAESKEGESLWDRLSNAVGSIWDFILNGVVGWLEQTIVKRALAWIAKKLDPTGVMAVITTIIDVFALLEAIMSKAKEIFEMIERVLDRIGEIIKGILPAAAEVLERALAAAIPVAMAILAAVVGLDGAVDAVKEEIEKLRKKIRDGIKRVMTSIKNWILQLLGSGSEGQGAAEGEIEKDFSDSHGSPHELTVSLTGAQPDVKVSSAIPTGIQHQISDRRKAETDESNPRPLSAEQKDALDKAWDQHTELVTLSRRYLGADDTQKPVFLSQIQALMDKLAGNMVRGDAWPDTEIKPTQVTFSGSGGSKQVVASPLTRRPGNTVGSAAQDVISGWQTNVGTQTAGRGGSIPWRRVHLLSDRLHGPGNNPGNLIPGQQITNGAMERGPESESYKRITHGETLEYTARVTGEDPTNSFFPASPQGVHVTVIKIAPGDRETVFDQSIPTAPAPTGTGGAQLTPSQTRVVDAYRDLKAKTGKNPTMAEVATELNFTSRGTVGDRISEIREVAKTAPQPFSAELQLALSILRGCGVPI